MVKGRIGPVCLEFECTIRRADMPSGIEEFVEHVVPVLQKRGVFRSEPVGRTLRESMGLAMPAATAMAAE